MDKNWRLIIGSDVIPPKRIRAVMVWVENKARQLGNDKAQQAWALAQSTKVGPLALDLT
jgi:hypothetical protein